MQIDNHLALAQKYSVQGPRYTSYPTALQFSEKVDFNKIISKVCNNESEKKDVSLYIHIPFCKKHCYFCGCLSTVCTDEKIANEYILNIKKELSIWKNLGLKKRTIKQIHFGGGTPNFLTKEQILRLYEILQEYFIFDENLEGSVEIDPRVFNPTHAEAFAKMGIKRASFGVQDLDENVQKAIGRIQPFEQNDFAWNVLKENGFNSLNIDLVYGLCLQTKEGFKNTILKILEINPDRFAIFNYAHIPWIKPAQKILEKYEIPTGTKKIEIFLQAVETLTKKNFKCIGLDHFCKENDSLYIAQKNKTLQRNFQGYSTHKDLEIFALGLSSISQTKSSYYQNVKIMKDYKAMLEANKLPLERGYILSKNDIFVRNTIMQIMCNLEFECENFFTLFADKIEKLKEFEKDGLLEFSSSGIKITALGKFFIRNIAMVFDEYLAQNQKNYSKTV